MKLALFTPLNPKRTGISDYIEELLPFLEPEFDLIDLFIEDYEPENQYIRDHFNSYHYLLFEEQYTRKKHDALFYQMGNSEFHKYMVGISRLYPGVLLLHDFNLHHLIAETVKYFPTRKKYLEEAIYNHGKLCKKLLSTTMEHTYQEFQLFYYPMNLRIIEPASAIIVHSEYLKQLIHALIPGKPVEVVPHHFWVDHHPEETELSHIKQKYDLREDDILVGCLGNIIPTKEPLKIAEVCSRIRHEFDNLVLVFAGNLHNPMGKEWIDKFRKTGLRIIVTGYLSKNEFEKWLKLMDIIINIRYPSTGETSGSLIKAMGLGKPLIISDLEQYREIAEDACLRVDIDDESGKMLEEAIRKLVKDGNLRSQIGYNAEKHIDQFHKINNSAGKIANFVKLHGISHASSEPYDVSFLYKVEQLGFLDHLAKEITQISEGPASGNLVELISEVVADFEG